LSSDIGLPAQLARTCFAQVLRKSGASCTAPGTATNRHRPLARLRHSTALDSARAVVATKAVRLPTAALAPAVGVDAAWFAPAGPLAGWWTRLARRPPRRSEVAGSAPPGGGRPVLLIGSGHPARPGCRAARNAASLNLTMTLPAGAKASQARSGAPALAHRPRLQDGPQHSSVFGPPDGSPEPNRARRRLPTHPAGCVARDASALSGLRNHLTKG